MNGNEYFLDTNVIIYLLNGNERIADILDKSTLSISFISELELLSKKNLQESEVLAIRGLISECDIVGINEEIKLQTIEIRKNTALKLPDALVAAAAIWKKKPLFTADVAFKNVEGLDAIIFNV